MLPHEVSLTPVANSLHSYIHSSSTQLLRTTKDPRVPTVLESIELYRRFKRLCCSGDFIRLLSTILGELSTLKP